MTDSALDVALDYGWRGLYVLPLHYPIGRDGRVFCSCGNAECRDVGKHPYARLAPNGLKNATKDPAVIRRWFSGAPFNVGIRTGAVSKIVALDIDPRHGGDESLAALERTHGPLPASWRFLTGGGGEHVLFRHPGGIVKNGVSCLGPGLDIRADGGYIVAPPSLHASGRRYGVSVDHDSADGVVLEELPEWLAAQLRVEPRRKSAAMPETWRKLVSDGVAEGRRNDAVARLAGHLLRCYVDPFVVLDLARCWNQGRCRPPLPDDELVRTVNSVCQAEMARREAVNGGR